jgi:hypothetical protein
VSLPEQQESRSRLAPQVQLPPVAGPREPMKRLALPGTRTAVELVAAEL